MNSCRESYGGPIWVKEGHLEPWHPPDVIIVPESESFDEPTLIQGREKRIKNSAFALSLIVFWAF